jgi:hypothetical protein
LKLELELAPSRWVGDFEEEDMAWLLSPKRRAGLPPGAGVGLGGIGFEERACGIACEVARSPFWEEADGLERAGRLKAGVSGVDALGMSIAGRLERLGSPEGCPPLRCLGGILRVLGCFRCTVMSLKCRVTSLTVELSTSSTIYLILSERYRLGLTIQTSELRDLDTPSLSGIKGLLRDKKEVLRL